MNTRNCRPQKFAFARSALLTHVLLTLLGLPAVAGESSNLLRNPGFEAGLDGWSVPAEAVVDTTVPNPEPAVGGAASGSLRLSRSEPAGWTAAAQTLPVEGRGFYRFECRLRLRNVLQTHMKVTWFDADGQPLETSFIMTGVNGDRDWFQVSKGVRAPEQAVRARLNCMAGASLDGKNPGLSWFDAFNCERIRASAPTLTSAEWAAQVLARYGEGRRAPPMTERVVYYDPRYDGSGVRNLPALLTYLNAHGFGTQDADALCAWMRTRSEQGADGTVCILAMGMVPDTITERDDTRCTLRRYLDAGGRVVWIGDVPLFYQSYPDRAPVAGWGRDVPWPAPVILGVENGKWDMVDAEVAVTAAGREWGMQVPGVPLRTILADSATLVFSEAAGTPYACSYFRNYNPEYPYSGFVRYGGGGGHDGKDPRRNADLVRLALYRGEPVTVTVTAAAVGPAAKPAALLTVETEFRNVPRGRPVRVRVNRNVAAPPGRCRLRLLRADRVVREIDGPPSGTGELELDTAALAAGDYTLTVSLQAEDGSSAATASAPLFLAPRRTPKYPIGMYAVSGGSTEYKTNLILEDLREHLGECGVITSGGGFIADQALRYGLRLLPRSNAYYASLMPRTRYPERQMRVATGELPKYNYGGGAHDAKAPLCMANPLNRARINAEFQRELRAIRDYPAFMKRMYVSDDAGMFGDPAEKLLACYCDYCRRTFRDLTGFDAPRAPAPGVLERKGTVSDRAPWYLWMKFRSSYVYGGWNRSMEQAKDEIDPTIEFGPIPAGGSSPVLNPGWALNPPDNYGGIGMASFYYYPQRGTPAKLLTLCAGARMGNRDNELWVIPQGSDYARTLNDPVLHKRLVRNEFFVLLSAGATGMTYYHYPLMPGTAAWEEFKRLSRIGTEYGPLLGRLRPAPRPVAVLASYCNAAYQWAEGGGGLPPIHLSLLHAHLPVDLVADEEVLAGILAKYRVLILNNIDYLTESVVAAIAEFVGRGGAVLADAASEVHIPAAQPLPTEPDSHRLTAAAAATIRSLIPAVATVDTEDVFVSEWQGGDARYIMLVNGSTERPATGRLTLPAAADAHDCRDVFQSRRLTEHDGAWEVNLEPGGGMLVGVLPAAIENVALKLPETAARGESLVCEAEFRTAAEVAANALLPVRVRVLGPDGADTEYSDWYAAAAGRLSVAFVPAENDPPGEWRIEMRELVTGCTGGAGFRLH